jgi:hypothetical protein
MVQVTCLLGHTLEYSRPMDNKSFMKEFATGDPPLTPISEKNNNNNNNKLLLLFKIQT